MDDQFDQLSRALAGHLPRRHALKLALKLIGATAAGMGAALLGLRPAGAEQVNCCADPTCNNAGDECCNGEGRCVLDPSGGFVCDCG